jgi:universal stress protein E
MVSDVESLVESAVRKVFVVLDPTRMTQPSLEKGEWIAARNGATLHLYCCCYDSQLAFDPLSKQAELERTRRWIERIAAGATANGAHVETEIGWDPDWRQAIVAAVNSSGAELVVKTASRHSPLARHLMKTADWALLRNAACPTLLISPTESNTAGPVLAAVKVRPDDERYVALNQRVLTMGERVARAVGSELQAVTAYRGEQIYFDRQRFADSCGLPRHRVHAVEGPPHRAIADAARKLHAGIVVIGFNNDRDEERGSLVSDTAGRLVDAVECDVVVVPLSNA